MQGRHVPASHAKRQRCSLKLKRGCVPLVAVAGLVEGDDEGVQAPGAALQKLLVTTRQKRSIKRRRAPGVMRRQRQNSELVAKFIKQTNALGKLERRTDRSRGRSEHGKFQYRHV